MAEKKSGGRGYGGFHQDATPETIELAKYLRALVKRAGKTQRDLEVPTGYGKSSISQYLSGEALPSETFVRKLVAYVTHPRQRQTCMDQALRLFVAAQRPKPAPQLPAPRPKADGDPPGAAALASVAATAQDQAAKAQDQLAQAHERNRELMEERGRTQQLVLNLSRMTADLQQQVTTLQDQRDEENEENEARLRQLTDQLQAAQRELRRARSSRDETEVLLARLRKRSDELEEELAQSRRTVTSGEELGLPPMPEELQEAFFRADFEKALRAAHGFLDDGQQRRDEVSDEWGLLRRRSALHTAERLRTCCHVLGRALGCLAMMSAAALHLAATRSGAGGWTVLLDVLMLVGIGFVIDPWGPMAQLWPAIRAGLRREPMTRPITISARATAVRAGRCLLAGLAAAGAALSVQCSVQWSAWWLFPLLPATAACAGYAVFGHDQRVVLLVQEALGELGADFKTPPPPQRAPIAAMGMTAPVVVSDSEWLEARRKEIGDSLTGGWKATALWIKLLVLFSGVLVGIAVLGVLANTVSHTTRTWHTPHGWHWHGVIATIDQPVRAYLSTHSAGLPLPVTSLHLLWIGSGSVLLAMSFLFGGFGARTTWILWGAATVVMVWSGTPGPARQVAAGLATIAWGLASILAMQGLNLRSSTSHSVFISKDS
ncbi:helix-turn-helix domain-containing protein [Streptomyces sp. NPDC048192]|uniref:helix-turn-helix domain-containing protein n=1 Tax=Streptomyces sp. NPDC048192 TaxID=3365510 RepID=UPI00370F7D1F